MKLAKQWGKEDAMYWTVVSLALTGIIWAVVYEIRRQKKVWSEFREAVHRLESCTSKSCPI